MKSKSKLKQPNKKISYFTYNKLVGQADNGKQIPKKQFEQLLQKYHNSWDNRLYVHFSLKDMTKQCIRVKPPCLCFCSHTFKSHQWWDIDLKQVKCRVPQCQCSKFRYLHHQGSWFLSCICKHTATDHNYKGKQGGCTKCQCHQFKTTFACMCGKHWIDHDTIATSEKQRRDRGLPVDTDTVKLRLKNKKVQGCGKCMGCKNRMPCYNKVIKS